jgi:hypothetical protein
VKVRVGVGRSGILVIPVLVLGLAVLGIFSVAAGSARADNAFPASQTVMLPVDRPQQIVVGTTFGLVFSEDDGITWTYSCEQPQATPMGRQYRMGPPPDDRIYAISNLGVPVSADGACTWTLPRGPVAPLLPLDVWPDPSLAGRSFVLALNPADQVASAFRSSDGGATYQGPIYVAEDATITGIESAASDPGVVYLTLVRRSDAHPLLVRSSDGGDTWAATDIAQGIGLVTPRLVAVDPVDPDKVLLLLLSEDPGGAERQGLAVTTDAGATWRSPLLLDPPGTLTGFARLPDGVLFLVGSAAADVTPVPDGGEAVLVPTLFRSVDGGGSFTSAPLPFHAVGLAQRDGILFAAANNFQDGFALASSADSGRTWTPRLRFRDISAIKACARTACLDDCDYQAGTTLFRPETCGSTADAAADKPVAEPPAPRPSGCGCSMPWSPSAAGDALPLRAILLLGLWGVVRKRSRSRLRPPKNGV